MLGIAGCGGGGTTPSGTTPANGTTLDMANYAASCAGTGVSYSGGATYAVCVESVAAAIATAKTALNAGSGSYIISVAAGTYNLSSETLGNHATAKGVMDVSGVWPTASGATLTITGAGAASTVLVTDNSLVTVWGSKTEHVHISGFFFQRDNPTTTFGTVTSSCGSGSVNATGQITISVPPGFPTAQSIYEGLGGTSMWIRAYDNSNPLNPSPAQLTDANGVTNYQINWGEYAEPTGSGQNWTLYFSTASAKAPLFYCSPGIVVAVKSKFDADAYNFEDQTGTTGTDIGFDGVVWQDEGRGVFRNVTYAYVTNSSIVQRAPIAGQAWVLSTPAGGPQIGEEGDGAYSILHAVVSNYSAANTGDDSVAFFNDGYTSGTGVISNVTISNSFARDINLYNSCYVALSGLNITGCNPQAYDVPAQYNGCVTDTDQITTLSNRVPECNPDYPL